MHRLVTTLAFLAAGVLGVGCEGPVGPEGPQGPPGPQGIQGEPGDPGTGTRLTFGGIIEDEGGLVFVQLPAEAGTAGDPPSVTCYISETLEGPYFAIGSSTGALCGILTEPTGLVAFLGADQSLYFRIVVIF